MANEVRVDGVDLGFTWLHEPRDASVEAGQVTIEAGRQTDMFRDPGGGDWPGGAPALLAELPDGDHQLSARVQVGFGAMFDAGVLLLWVDDRRFAKLCLERSPAGDPMVVSVVTREVSDDANGYVVRGREDWWLRISTLGDAYAFHASADGQHWDLIRYFALGGDARPRIGLQAQSPTGEGCRVTFTDIAHHMGRLAELRDGS